MPKLRPPSYDRKPNAIKENAADPRAVRNPTSAGVMALGFTLGTYRGVFTVVLM